ncbi:MAG: alpha/beta fold hydrolase [Verrucomicrobiota bacterium]|nr:alpha/beta fold hydrolase [Verrucomicrobiota bacterium]
MSRAANMVFIPGWGANERLCRGLADSFPEDRFRFLSWCDVLRDGSSAVDRAMPSDGSPCALAGWSLGALLALRAALDRPRRFAALILISATGRMTSAPGHAGVAPRALRAMRLGLNRNPEAVARDFAVLSMTPDGNDASAVEYVRQTLTHGTDDLAAGLDALGKLDLREQAARVAVPLLLVHGAEDRVIPARAGRELADTVPGARLAILPGRGHALPILAPSALAAMMKEFAA